MWDSLRAHPPTAQENTDEQGSNFKAAPTAARKGMKDCHPLTSPSHLIPGHMGVVLFPATTSMARPVKKILKTSLLISYYCSLTHC